MADTSIITVRLPKSMVERADALVPVLAEDEEALFLGRASRSIVLRLALLRGLESLEAQTKKAPRARGKAR